VAARVEVGRGCWSAGECKRAAAGALGCAFIGQGGGGEATAEVMAINGHGAGLQSIQRGRVLNGGETVGD
jgi:hypothetical protein